MKLKGIKSGKKFPIHFVLLPEVREAAAASLQCGLVKAGQQGMRASFPTMQWACRIGPPAAQRLLLTPSSSVGDRAQICFPPVSSCLAEFRLGKRIYMVILAPKVLSSSSSIDSLGLNCRVEPCGPPCLRDWSPSLVSKKTSAKEGFLKFPRL